MVHLAEIGVLQGAVTEIDVGKIGAPAARLAVQIASVRLDRLADGGVVQDADEAGRGGHLGVMLSGASNIAGST